MWKCGRKDAWLTISRRFMCICDKSETLTGKCTHYESNRLNRSGSQLLDSRAHQVHRRLVKCDTEQSQRDITRNIIGNKCSKTNPSDFKISNSCCMWLLRLTWPHSISAHFVATGRRICLARQPEVFSPGLRPHQCYEQMKWRKRALSSGAVWAQPIQK